MDYKTIDKTMEKFNIMAPTRKETIDALVDSGHIKELICVGSVHIYLSHDNAKFVFMETSDNMYMYINKLTQQVVPNNYRLNGIESIVNKYRGE